MTVLREGRWVWVNGKPKHESQMYSVPMFLTGLGMVLCFVLYYLSLAL